MYIEINDQSEIPIYLQLANQIIQAIATGDALPYESLPSGRALAGDLGINMHTVNKAYHYLEDKRFIQVLPKSGAIIHPEAIRTASDEEREGIRDRLQPIIDEAKCLKLTDEEIYQLIKGEKK
ncbi:GntR family transcriptional regulator [Macrococcus brunensis]|uniref:GntR family transcriptional regulator n=1 Tax=Macrococcus brunensis TaxID=198483 RepID=A0A4R6BEU3_9STAP|nr:GntR family transcriptional regulator [Macrococcus brunensis]TDL98351.1 GntR family transcriptional regulator [Macrococcus brunensis]ULG73117.1 GntR family transcriptional regulator [Macrococcus brunensis]ULG75297.1 GntR family transcriptional regulator [Macrococcus brunensis]